MFIVSKIVWIAGQPLSLVLLLSCVGWLLLLSGQRRLGLLLTLASPALLFLVMFTNIGAMMLQELENRFPRPAADPVEVKCMIVLGGGLATGLDRGRGGYNLGDAGDRYIETIRLAHKYPQSLVIISGGDGTLEGGHVSEALVAADMLADFGVFRDRILLDDTSRNTFENARNTRNLMESRGLSECLLITSGFHMPRSVAVFRAQGLHIVPWDADYRTSGRERFNFDLTQPIDNAANLTTAIKEWVGIAGYYFAGRVSTLYPSP